MVEVHIIGDDPLTDGMAISVRIRRDFTVTHAAGFLAAARRMYVELNPGSDLADAEEMVTCAADAMFTLLEHVGMTGDRVTDQLAGQESDGLRPEGWQAQVVLDEPDPLPSGQRCLVTEDDDVFALPATRSRLRPRA
jgi:hypothetical protein